MSIKKTIYKVKSQNGYDIYHFESDNGQIQILDSENNVLGTLKEFAQEGKVVSSGKVTDLKITGLYKIKNVTGLPEGVDIDKMSILSILAVGKTGAPDAINYELITSNGSVYNKVVVPGSSSTEWTNGGTKLQNSINTLISNFGSLSSLNTQSKSNLVSAINEVDTNIAILKSDFITHLADYDVFKRHNHDDRYIKKTGDQISGDIVFSSGTGFVSKNADGKSLNVIKQSFSGQIELGDINTPINIYGSKITHNDKKIWTEANDGKGSGLDADKLQGKDASEYAQLSIRNDFQGDVAIRSGKSVVFQSDLVRQGVFWRNENGTTNAAIKHEGSNAIGFYNGSTLNNRIESDGTWYATKRIEFDASKNENRVAFKLKSSEKGMGMYRNTTSKYLGFYNWDKSERLAYFHDPDGYLFLDKAPSVQGRRLYMQSGQPTGSIPEGSIWIS